jgi:acetyltransferase-like isoleucine patch superfamily enzyme
VKIHERTARVEYEKRIAPRSMLRLFLQKALHILARSCIHPGLRLWLYRRMGVSIGRGVFVGLDAYLDDQFPELIEIQDDVVISFRAMLVVHDDARRMDGVVAGRNAGTVAPVVLERGCYLGAGCTVLPGVRVGVEAVVGAGAVVTRDVPPRTIAVGVPARALRATDE